VKRISYAQNFEDVMLARALADVSNGFYVDVGAQDPVIDSVTKWFYERGWKGVNIEPVAHWFERIQEDRPRDTNLMCAVASTPGMLEIHESQDSGLSTASDEYARAHVAAGRAMVKRTVPTSRLDDILAKHAPANVHFLKIDVEGMEADVLASLSLRRFRPWILVIEATRPNTDTDVSQTWEGSVLDSGYRLVYRDGLNRFYLAEEQMSRASAFDVPPNVFDDFIHYREHAGNEYSKSLEGRLQDLHDISERLRIELARMADVAGAQHARIAELDEAVRDRQSVLEETARQAEAWRVDLLTVAATAEARQQRAIELEARIVPLEGQVAELEGQVSEQAEQLAHARTREAELHQAVVLGQDELRMVVDAAENRRVLVEQLETRLKQADNQLRQLAIDLHAASIRTGELQRELGQVYASRSWRLTAPLRSLAGFARSVTGKLLRGAADVPLLRRVGARILDGRMRDRVLRLAGFSAGDSLTAGPTTEATAANAGGAPLSRAAARVYQLLEQEQGKPLQGTNEDRH
jgi:FkbM family methyltransferase